MYPRIQINLSKLEHNTKTLVQRCQDAGITTIFGVTKVLAGDQTAIQTLINSGITHLADSRIENFKRMNSSLPKVLLRLPMLSEIQDLVQFVDLSLNSELETIFIINEEAKKQEKVHQIILMFDLGDLREGIWFKSDYIKMIEQIINLTHVQLVGIGTNLTCYGGVIPNQDNLSELLKIKENIKNQFDMQLDIISGGNSSSLHLVFNDSLPKGINNIRLGEALVLGRETAYGEDIEDCYQDVFELHAQIIEIKEKPSMPLGEVGMDAFGNKPEFVDRGLINRAIVAVGKQDVNHSNIHPLDPHVEILGSSSDHLILDVSKGFYQVGDIITFKVDYGSLLSLMTSPYVFKVYQQ